MAISYAMIRWCETFNQQRMAYWRLRNRKERVRTKQRKPVWGLIYDHRPKKQHEFEDDYRQALGFRKNYKHLTFRCISRR
jgi:hypothetical protein